MSEERSVPLTRDAYDRLREKLAFMEGEGRSAISEEIGVARAHGDLSENAEYHAAKEKQGQQEAEIRRLREMIEHAEIIEAEDDGVVAPGKLVTIRQEDDEDPETYLLGLREERLSGYDVLTPESPLGQALVGRSAGETIVASVPAGEMRVEIVAVKAP